MRSTIAFLLLTMLGGCSIKTVALKGSYPDKPFEVVADKPTDKVWDNIIDFFATKGLSIRIIDKSSGLIVSDKTALVWSYEDGKGMLISRDAWIAVPKQIDPGTNKPIPFVSITGDWNIRIKEQSPGKTLINVNLVNIQSQAVVHNLLTPPTIISVVGAKTTGVFEKMIADIIK